VARFADRRRKDGQKMKERGKGIVKYEYQGKLFCFFDFARAK
jgi:hypothetical protein